MRLVLGSGGRSISGSSSSLHRTQLGMMTAISGMLSLTLRADATGQAGTSSSYRGAQQHQCTCLSHDSGGQGLVSGVIKIPYQVSYLGRKEMKGNESGGGLIECEGKNNSELQELANLTPPKLQAVQIGLR